MFYRGKSDKLLEILHQTYVELREFRKFPNWLWRETKKRVSVTVTLMSGPCFFSCLSQSLSLEFFFFDKNFMHIELCKFVEEIFRTDPWINEKCLLFYRYYQQRIPYYPSTRHVWLWMRYSKSSCNYYSCLAKEILQEI